VSRSQIGGPKDKGKPEGGKVTDCGMWGEKNKRLKARGPVNGMAMQSQARQELNCGGEKMNLRSNLKKITKKGEKKASTGHIGGLGAPSTTHMKQLTVEGKGNRRWEERREMQAWARECQGKNHRRRWRAVRGGKCKNLREKLGES